MDAQLARLFLGVDGLDDAAWTVVAAAASGVDEDRLAAVLAGRAGTATLPDHAALRALARLDDAQIPAALHGEQRASVLDVAASRTGPAPDSAPLTPAQRLNAELLTRLEGQDTPPADLCFKIAAKVATDTDLEDVAVAEWLAGLLSWRTQPRRAMHIDSERARFTAAYALVRDPEASLAGLLAGVLDRRRSNGDQDATAALGALISAVCCRHHETVGVCPDGVTLGRLEVALAWTHRLEQVAVGPLDEKVTPAQMGAWLAERFCELGGPLLGPGGVAERAMVAEPPGVCSAADLGWLCRVAQRSPGGAQLATLATAATASGTRARPIDRFDPTLAPPTLTAAEAVCALPSMEPPSQVLDAAIAFVSAVAGTAGHRWEPGDVLAAFELRPDVAKVIADQLVALVDFKGVPDLDDVPRWLVDWSMRTAGLGQWLHRRPQIRSELAQAAAGAGADRWRVMLTLADTFHGTPSELAAVAGEVAPS